MDAFLTELMRRSPLATAVLDICDYLLDDCVVSKIWEDHRGRCYQDRLTFPQFLRLMRDALIHHGGSAHKLFVNLESTGSHPINESNFYRKLARTPILLSRALLADGTRRLSELVSTGRSASTGALKPVVDLPGCFDKFRVFVGDGKTIKNVAKRLAPTRGFIGKLLGAKTLVAIDLRSGLAVAMSDTLDGLANEVPLVPLLIPQLHAAAGDEPMLSVWDRQFDDPATMRLLSSRDGDAFVVRCKHKNMKFAVESAVESVDAQGRRVLDQIGVLGQGKAAIRVRRVTLFRDAAADEDDVVLLSNLLDRRDVGPLELLALYKHRWSIENVFQQVTETFGLSHLIGCKPKAVLLQFSFCLLLYNVMQVVKSYVAADGNVPAADVSMHYLFEDVKEELSAWAYHGDGQWPSLCRTAAALHERLSGLLANSWDPVRYTKAKDKNPRKIVEKKKLWLSGGCTSVQRILEGRAKVVDRAAVVTRDRVMPIG